MEKSRQASDKLMNSLEKHDSPEIFYDRLTNRVYMRKEGITRDVRNMGKCIEDTRFMRDISSVKIEDTICDEKEIEREWSTKSYHHSNASKDPENIPNVSIMFHVFMCVSCDSVTVFVVSTIDIQYINNRLKLTESLCECVYPRFLGRRRTFTTNRQFRPNV